MINLKIEGDFLEKYNQEETPEEVMLKWDMIGIIEIMLQQDDQIETHIKV